MCALSIWTLTGLQGREAVRITHFTDGKTKPKKGQCLRPPESVVPPAKSPDFRTTLDLESSEGRDNSLVPHQTPSIWISAQHKAGVLCTYW